MRERGRRRAVAWEWVAPTATFAVGAIGIVFTWLSSKQGKDHAERIAKLANEHIEAMAREERTQRRLEECYIALLDMAERAGQWAQMVANETDAQPLVLDPGGSHEF